MGVLADNNGALTSLIVAPDRTFYLDVARAIGGRGGCKGEDQDEERCKRRDRDTHSSTVSLPHIDETTKKRSLSLSARGRQAALYGSYRQCHHGASNNKLKTPIALRLSSGLVYLSGVSSTLNHCSRCSCRAYSILVGFGP